MLLRVWSAFVITLLGSMSLSFLMSGQAFGQDPAPYFRLGLSGYIKFVPGGDGEDLSVIVSPGRPREFNDTTFDMEVSGAASVKVDGMPNWLDFDQETRQFVGRSAVKGKYSITITLTPENGVPTVHPFELEVYPSLLVNYEDAYALVSGAEVAIAPKVLEGVIDPDRAVWSLAPASPQLPSTLALQRDGRIIGTASGGPLTDVTVQVLDVDGVSKLSNPFDMSFDKIESDYWISALQVTGSSTTRALVPNADGGVTAVLPPRSIVRIDKHGGAAWARQLPTGNSLVGGAKAPNGGIYYVSSSGLGFTIGLMSGTGDIQWVKSFASPTAGHTISPTAVGVGPDGDIYVAGNAYTTTLNGSDAFAARISASGEPRWLTAFGIVGVQGVTELAVTDNGDVWVAGTGRGGSVYNGTRIIAAWINGQGVPRIISGFGPTPETGVPEYASIATNGSAVQVHGRISNGNAVVYPVHVTDYGWTAAINSPQPKTRRAFGNKTAVAASGGQFFSMAVYEDTVTGKYRMDIPEMRRGYLLDLHEVTQGMAFAADGSSFMTTGGPSGFKFLKVPPSPFGKPTSDGKFISVPDTYALQPQASASSVPFGRVDVSLDAADAAIPATTSITITSAVTPILK